MGGRRRGREKILKGTRSGKIGAFCSADKTAYLLWKPLCGLSKN